jgi:hypothetical protein
MSYRQQQDTSNPVKKQKQNTHTHTKKESQ